MPRWRGSQRLFHPELDLLILIFSLLAPLHYPT